MTDIVLVQPPFTDFYSTPQRTCPLGLLYIAGALEAAGYSVAVADAGAGDKRKSIPLPGMFDYLRPHYREDRSPLALFDAYYYFGPEIGMLVRQVQELQPRLVGISLLTTAYSSTAMSLARELKEACPGVALVGGGHHATHFPEACLEVFDYIIRGEGEASFVQLADRLLGDVETPDVIPGLCLPDGELCSPAWLAAESLEGLRPSRHLVTGPLEDGSSVMPILTSRGCPQACSYCCTGRKLSGGFRARSPDDVLAEIRQGLTEGYRHIDIEDENFAHDRGRALEILTGLAALRKEHDMQVSAMNGLLPETIDAELVAALSAAGFRELNLSLGATRPEVLARYRRPVTLMDTFLAAADAAQRAGLRTIAYTISGGPYAAAEDVVADLVLLAGIPARLGLSSYYPAPGSPDYSSGACAAPPDFDMYRASVYPVEGRMNRLQMITASRLSRLINFMKSLPGRGIEILPSDGLPRENTTVAPENTALLAAAAFHERRLPGLERDRGLYWHEADEEMVGACMAGLGKQGYIESFDGKLTLCVP